MEILQQSISKIVSEAFLEAGRSTVFAGKITKQLDIHSACIVIANLKLVFAS